MVRLVVCVLALLAVGGSADPLKVWPQKPADPVLLQIQLDLMELYYHIHEPITDQEQKVIVSTWSLEKNIEHYSNVTAVKLWIDMFEYGLIPRGVPFSVLEETHLHEAVTLFNVLFSAKDYSTFYKTAVWVRDHVNEGLFIYALSVAIIHRPDTQGVIVPPIYEVFPSYFCNGEVMTTAQRINTHGKHMVEYYPSTYVWDDNVVIRMNETVWPYFSVENPISYFTHDHLLNTFYYNKHLTYPKWLGGEVVPLAKDRRGEWFWFLHKQLLTRYYMERLSNDLGEIPVLGFNVVEEGYTSGLVYHNGIPFPVRPNHFHLNQLEFVDELKQIEDFERRVRDAIDVGYVINHVGEHVSIQKPEAIEILGNLIEVNVDSVNTNYYKDFISVWKALLGNSVVHDHYYHQKHVPLVLPSVLEHYQTALRDPAFYMIWKRVLHLFTLWQESLPLYRPEELALPSVKIQDVDVDKLVTYFEYTYMNVTSHLHSNEHERTTGLDDTSVLVQRPQLNHKLFNIRVKVHSDVPQTVVVRFFLAPKYDSHGYEIPLHKNTENFFLMDQFTYDLSKGETVINRGSNENMWTIKDWTSAHILYQNVQSALVGNGQFILDQSQNIEGFPQRLMLPKGRVGGMPFVLMVYISEYHAPKVHYGTGFDPAMSLGIGSGARRMSDDPLGFPLNKPLHEWQVQDLHNLVFEDVTIYHKNTPEIKVPFTE